MAGVCRRLRTFSVSVLVCTTGDVVPQSCARRDGRGGTGFRSVVCWVFPMRCGLLRPGVVETLIVPPMEVAPRTAHSRTEPQSCNWTFIIQLGKSGGMELPKGVEWGAHALVVLHRLSDQGPVQVRAIAEVYGLPVPYLTKQMQAMVQHGLVTSLRGAGGGHILARLAAEISLADVVEAVNGPQPVFRCTEIRCQGVFADKAETVRASGPCGIAQAMHQAEAAWKAALTSVTIADLAAGIDQDSHQRMLRTLTPRP